MDEKLIPKIDFNEYSKDKYLLDLGNYEIKEENGKIFAVLKKPKYPKTYEECCKNVFGLINGGMTVDVPMRYSPLIIDFTKLLICRDAYWKIYGEETGFEKHWEPDWNNDYSEKHCIIVDGCAISKCTFRNTQFMLAFPTKEMRDTFYKNFKDLIEQCKGLL